MLGVRQVLRQTSPVSRLCQSHEHLDRRPPAHRRIHQQHSCQRESTANRLPTRLDAVRRQEASTVQPSAADQIPADVDADFIDAFNELCTGAVRAMLSGDPWAVERFSDTVGEAGNLFAEEGNEDACRFTYVLYHMCKHKLVKQHADLSGIYETAFNRIFGLVEDSGWQLVKEGEKAQEHVDDEVLQPPPGSVLQNYN